VRVGREGWVRHSAGVVGVGRVKGERVSVGGGVGMGWGGGEAN